MKFGYMSDSIGEDKFLPITSYKLLLDRPVKQSIYAVYSSSNTSWTTQNDEDLGLTYYIFNTKLDKDKYKIISVRKIVDSENKDILFGTILEDGKIKISLMDVSGSFTIYFSEV